MLHRINYTVLMVTLGLVALLLPMAAAAQEADILEVEYEATPLFQNSNVLPGDTVAVPYWSPTMGRRLNRCMFP